VKSKDKTLPEESSKEDIKLLEETFTIRNELQYYADREESQKKLKELNKKAKQFYIKTKEIINKITEEQAETIKKQLLTKE